MNILQPNETYRGRGYSEWIEEWSNLLVSSSPDTQSGIDMLFLRGNLDYDFTERGKGYREQDKFFNKTGGIGETIYKNTALFVPVMTAMYSINDVYEARQLLDEEALRYAVRKDTSESGSMWLRYKYSKSEYQPAISSRRGIKDYYFETAKFTLNVSSENPFLGNFEYPLIPGQNETVQGGYFVILKDLEPGPYRFHFGGFGRGFYYTDAVYDIKVLDVESRDLPEDVSGKGGKTIILEKTFLHLKTESKIDDTSPFP